MLLLVDVAVTVGVDVSAAVAAAADTFGVVVGGVAVVFVVVLC